MLPQYFSSVFIFEIFILVPFNVQSKTLFFIWKYASCQISTEQVLLFASPERRSFNLRTLSKTNCLFLQLSAIFSRTHWAASTVPTFPVVCCPFENSELGHAHYSIQPPQNPATSRWVSDSQQPTQLGCDVIVSSDLRHKLNAAQLKDKAGAQGRGPPWVGPAQKKNKVYAFFFFLM